MPSTRKISPARKPLNTVYEDALAAFSAAIAPLYNEVRELKAMAKQQKALTYPQIKQQYNFSRYDLKKFEKEGRLTRLGKGRPKYSSVELDQIILEPKYSHKMSAV